ncbi:hypothetical protein MAR_015943 [Mya arenaria]|uniref:Uncharacterized protein n=1 Tax=Mya arenaria TaxID=6604 RepID=A0ABY7FLC0_MYAAR|nr:hypothetical protein MAR_015943 [Mya arenaria]
MIISIEDKPFFIFLLHFVTAILKPSLETDKANGSSMSISNDASMSPSDDIWMMEFVFALQTNKESSGPKQAPLGTRIRYGVVHVNCVSIPVRKDNSIPGWYVGTFTFTKLIRLARKLHVIKVTLLAVHVYHPGRPPVVISAHYKRVVFQVTDGEAECGYGQRLHQRDRVVTVHCQQADGSDISVTDGYCNIVIRVHRYVPRFCLKFIKCAEPLQCVTQDKTFPVEVIHGDDPPVRQEVQSSNKRLLLVVTCLHELHGFQQLQTHRLLFRKYPRIETFVFLCVMNNEATSDLSLRRQGSHLLPISPPTTSLPHSRRKEKAQRITFDSWLGNRKPKKEAKCQGQRKIPRLTDNVQNKAGIIPLTKPHSHPTCKTTQSYLMTNITYI